MKINKRNLFQRYALLLFLSCSFLSYAGIDIGTEMQRMISGTVYSSQGLPLPGVNVVVQGTSIGSLTDFDGNYTIEVPNDNSILIFSYVGFAAKEVAVKNQTTINVTLQEETTSLEQIVVIGYGNRKKSELIGSVATVQAEGIQEQVVSTFEQSLVGQVAGVQFSQNGAPDGGPEVLVRGIASTGANNAPLYVVDGFPLGNVDSQRDNFLLSAINPSNIESISILKDASSKAIYGSRAANGVVVITTKRGRKSQSPTVTFSTSAGIQSVPDYEAPDVLNTQELLNYQIEWYEDRLAAVGVLGGREIASRDALIALRDSGAELPDNDWFDLITRDAYRYDYNVNVSGGGEKSRYNVNMGYLNQEGTLINTGFKRYNIDANIDIDIKENLKFSLNFAPSQSIATGGRTDSNAEGFDIYKAVALAGWTDPSAALYDEDGNLTNVADGQIITFARNINPVALLTVREEERKTNQLRMGSFLEYEVLKGLKLKTFGSLNYVARRNSTFEPSTLPGSALVADVNGDGQASASLFELNNFNWIWENTINYNTMFGEHSLDLFGGFVMEDRNGSNTRIDANNLINEEIKIPNSNNVDLSDPNNFVGRGGEDNTALVSLIGRLDYSFKDRYFLTATIRRDGSSKFGSENRYGNFPSVGVAWRISQEPFFENIKSVFSDFKIEAGYGITGSNANVGTYQAQGRINSVDPSQDRPNYLFGDILAPGSSITELPNNLLTWEEAKETNFGVDLGFIQNRFLISMDYYNIESEGFLSSIPLPSTSGYPSVIDNLGSIQNRGFEVAINANVIQRKDIQWDISANFTTNKSEVLELAAEAGFIRPGAIAGINFTETREGEEIGLYRGLNVTGLFTQEDIDNPDQPKYQNNSQVVGSLKFEDVNEDGILNKEDATIIGNPNPDFLIGMTQNFRYKDFDLRVVLNGSFGGQVIDLRRQYLGNQDRQQFNIERALLDRWRPGDDPNSKTIPGTGSTGGNGSAGFFRSPNSLAIQDNDYVWIRNITLGYNLDDDVFKDIFKNARVYVTVQNPFLITDYTNGNPDINRSADTALVRGANYGAYPIARTYSVGFNVTF